MENKQYLGDGVYVEHDEQGMLTLSVQNAGEAFAHSIHLEPEVYAALVAYVARVIRIVRAGPSEASATLETARRRLAAVAESMTEHAYQEMASALEVDACRVEPSEASAVEVLRSFIAWVDCDPMPLARAAMRETEVEAEFFRAERMSEFLAVPRQNLNEVREERRAAVDAYRKAGGK